MARRSERGQHRNKPKIHSAWADLNHTLSLYAVWAVSFLIDSTFLVLWATIQWIVSNKIVRPLMLSGIDKFVLTVFEVLFAISTLAPIAITTYSDIRIMLMRAERKIRNENKIGGYDEPS